MKRIIFLVLLLLPSLVFAKGLVPCGGPGEQMCDFCDFATLVNNVVRFLTLYLIAPAGTVAMIIAGIMLMMAAGDPGRLEKGKSIFRQALWGMVIAFAAWLVVDLVLGNLLQPGYVFWNDFPSCNLF